MQNHRRVIGPCFQWVQTCVITVVLLIIVESKATVFVVPDDFTMIQAAVNVTSPGDTVRVSPGVYHEVLILPPHDLCLLGDYVFTADSADLLGTVIDAETFSQLDTAAVITMIGGISRDTHISGFVLRHGTGTDLPQRGKNGGAIHMRDSSPRITACILENNSSATGAILSFGGGPDVRQCRFFGNWCGSDWLCLFLSNLTYEPIRFEWNRITGNSGPSAAVTEFSYADANVRYNRFHQLGTPGTWCLTMLESNGEVRGNVFEEIDGSAVGRPVWYLDRHVSSVSENTFRDIVLSGGRCIVIQRNHPGGTQLIERNLFQNLVQPDPVSGIALFLQHPDAVIVENTFVDCQGGGRGVIFLSLSSPEWCSQVVIRRNLFLRNSAPVDSWGAISVYPYGPCTMQENWFEGNMPLAVGQYELNHDWDVSGNYWGHPSGPFHPAENPSGEGDTIQIGCHATPWLTEPPQLVAHLRPSPGIPGGFSLYSVYPNPFNNSVHISLTASRVTALRLEVFDITGRLVRELWQGVLPAQGQRTVIWDGRDARGDAPTGMYLIAASELGSANRQFRKAVLLK